MSNDQYWFVVLIGIWDFIFGGSAGDRTRDLGLKRPLLYQLSYRSVEKCKI